MCLYIIALQMTIPNVLFTISFKTIKYLSQNLYKLQQVFCFSICYFAL